MKFKKLISIILIFIFVFSQSLIVFADDDDVIVDETGDYTLSDVLPSALFASGYALAELGVPGASLVRDVVAPNLSNAAKLEISTQFGIDVDNVSDDVLENVLLKEKKIIKILKDNGDIIESINKNGKRQISLSNDINNSLKNYIESNKPKYHTYYTIPISEVPLRYPDCDPLQFVVAYQTMMNQPHNESDYLMINHTRSWGFDCVFISQDTYLVPNRSVDPLYNALINRQAISYSVEFTAFNRFYNQFDTTHFRCHGDGSFRDSEWRYFHPTFSTTNSGGQANVGICWVFSDRKRPFFVYDDLGDLRNFLNHNSSLVEFDHKNIDWDNFSFTFDPDLDYQELIDTMYDIYKNGDWVTIEQLDEAFSKKLNEINQTLHDINNSLNDKYGNSYLRLIYEYLKNNVDLKVYDEIIDILNDIKNNNNSCDHTRIEELLELISENIGSDVSLDTTQIEDLLQQIIDNLPSGSSSDVELDRIEELLEQLVNKSSSNNSSQLQEIIDLLKTTNVLLGISVVDDLIDDLDWLSITNITKDMTLKGLVEYVGRVGSNRFPFTLTNDFGLILSVLHEKPEKPDFDYPINFLGHETSFNVNFDYYDTYARKYVEFFIILVFICGFIPVTISLIDTFRGE